MVSGAPALWGAESNHLVFQRKSTAGAQYNVLRSERRSSNAAPQFHHPQNPLIERPSIPSPMLLKLIRDVGVVFLARTLLLLCRAAEDAFLGSSNALVRM